MCRLAGSLVALALLGAVAGCASGFASGGDRQVLRVGTSADYAPFSHRSGTDEGGGCAQPDCLEGFDPAVARAYAATRELQVEWVRFRWPDLLSDLEAGRFDLAMSGVTVRPERSIAGRFSVPVAKSGAVLLTRSRPGGAAPVSLDQLDRPGHRIAVNAGGHLERVARDRLRRASLIAVADNDRVRDMLLSGEVDTAVTDTREAPHWRAAVPGLVEIGPFTRDRKAYLARADLPELSRDLDRWLIEKESDGTLDALRRAHLGSWQEPSTEPVLEALLASIDERLALMPWVAEAKRRSGSPVEAPEREQKVLEAAVASARRAAETLAGRPPAERSLRALFRAQMEAAKQIQRRTLSRPTRPEVGHADLADALRPALIRIGDRIAILAAQLPSEVDPKQVEASTRSALASRDLDDAHVAAIAAALIELME